MNHVSILRRITIRAGCCIALGLATGCAQDIKIGSDFPQPVVEALPLKLGLRYTEEFLTYTYAEDLPNEVSWSFDLGAANRKLFDRVFDSLVTEAVSLGDGEAPPGLDAVVEPVVEAMEFSLPRQSRSDQFAVWIRYQVQVFDRGGDVITILPVNAYGQGDALRFNSDEAMRQATVKAMRDAAVSIIVGFSEDEKIRKVLLEENPDESS